MRGLACFLALATVAPTGGGLDRVSAALRAAASWQVEFTQRYVPAGFDTGASESGSLTLAPPALLRFDYAGPPARTFASDGAVARQVEPDAATCVAVRVDATTWGRLPLAAVLDPGAARGSFVVTEEAGGLTLLPREPSPELARVDVRIGERSLPALVTVIDGSGNRNEFAFTRWRPRALPPLEFFRPALPDAAPCLPEEE